VFNILIDNTDDHEKNHALVADAAQRLHLSPAFDVLPSGQALGYQQLRVGRDGADSTLVNALSEHRAFALIEVRARQICKEVCAVVNGWQAHFAATGVSARDIELLAEQIDRPFLKEQRGFGS
jgi:serine/threonine-protein kinase HipA